MSIRRVFADWEKPFLHETADYLRQQFSCAGLSRIGSSGGDNGMLDLSDVIVAVPGKRAGRRLLELLVRGGAITPPRIVTGELPEVFYEPDRPVADELTVLLAWNAALRAAPKKILLELVPVPPEQGDISAWLDLASELAGVKSALASDMVSIDDVARKCRTLLPDFPEENRWKSLERVHTQYLAILHTEGMTDLHEARFRAIRDGRICSGHQARQSGKEIVLAGVSDLNGVTRRMLEIAASTPNNTNITILIPAPPVMQDLFDEFGRPLSSEWSARKIGIQKSNIKVVDQPRDEAVEVLKALQRDPALSPDQITIGLGDEAMAHHFVRVFGLAGVTARPPSLCKLLETAPMLLLESAARLSESRSFRDAAALMRHPDFDRYITGVLGSELSDNWLSRVDAAAAESQLRSATGPYPWAGTLPVGKDAALLKSVCGAALKFAPDDREKLPLLKWPEKIRAILRTIYEESAYEPATQSGRTMIEALKAIAGIAGTLERLPKKSSLSTSFSFAECFDVIKRLMGDETVPPESGEAAVEMLGWLELALDDAPRLIITDFNERFIPQSITSDPFLPDSVRRKLGLADNAQRYARDAFLLTVIIESRKGRLPGRPDVTFIASRRDSEGNPRIPSRLLLACDEADLPGRLAQFYDDNSSSQPAARILRGGKTNGLFIPPPEFHEPLNELRVTAFRDFIACPYRFYLKHILHLAPADEIENEWSRSAFGTIVHAALNVFGKSEVESGEACVDAGRIHRILCAALDDVVKKRYGNRLAPVFQIQKEIMKERFRIFSEVQAAHAASGWKIIDVEDEQKRFDKDIIVDGFPFKITGHIDRIDRHEDQGLLILDYKTGDSGASPEKKHGAGHSGHRRAKKWIDLQLPLYRELARANNQGPEPCRFQGEIGLGYFILGKKAGEIRIAKASWTEQEFAEAGQLAIDIIREIREGRFWKPQSPPSYDDGFGYLCMDDHIARNAVIDEVTRIYQPLESMLDRS